MQSKYVTLLRSTHAPMVVVTGGPGTGKTHHAVVEGVAALSRGEYAKLVLARPAINSGEDLGHLPGGVDDKLGPYMRPMLDALHTVMTRRDVRAMFDDGSLEMAPLAYMRGRTFKDAWVVLDEGQNTTPAQMKMVLTRHGKRSKMVVRVCKISPFCPPPIRTNFPPFTIPPLPGWTFEPSSACH